MKPRTEEFLNLLLWTADRLLHPTFRNLTDSYESWAYRTGLWRELPTLVARGLIERQTKAPHDRVYRLTNEGRVHALGGRDPLAAWARAWDGRWRLVVFDIPTARDSDRTRLRRRLRSLGFGYLQKSVWITPDPLRTNRDRLAQGEVDVESLVVLEARPGGGETDAQLVAGAWDFARINEAYARYLCVLEAVPRQALGTRAAARALHRWAAAERHAWLTAVSLDPLLPESLLPVGYEGKSAWHRRAEVFGETAEWMRGQPAPAAAATGGQAGGG